MKENINDLRVTGIATYKCSSCSFKLQIPSLTSKKNESKSIACPKCKTKCKNKMNKLKYEKTN